VERAPLDNKRQGRRTEGICREQESTLEDRRFMEKLRTFGGQQSLLEEKRDLLREDCAFGA
jgi:hypothetical protein